VHVSGRNLTLCQLWFGEWNIDGKIYLIAVNGSNADLTPSGIVDDFKGQKRCVNRLEVTKSGAQAGRLGSHNEVSLAFHDPVVLVMYVPATEFSP
jgi:hypothetical protein